MDESKIGTGDLYSSPAQAAPGSVCNMEGEGGSGTRARKSSERFQRGYVVLTNAVGVLSAATTQVVTLFQRGYDGDAEGAGYPSGAKFRDSETNVPDDNGLHDVVITAAAVEFEDPCYVTGSGDTFTVADSVELADYRDAIIRKVGGNLIVKAVVGPKENQISYSLGNPFRNPSMRGMNDLNAVGAHATPSVPLILREPIPVPRAKGSNRPFSITCNLGRALSIGARSTVATANVYVPFVVSLEVAQVKF